MNSGQPGSAGTPAGHENDGVGSAASFMGEKGGGIGYRLHATSISLISVSLVVVLLRLYVRKRMLNFMGSDDYMIIVALLAAFGVIACNFVSVSKGLGEHIWNLEPNGLPKILKISFISQIFYIFSLSLTKASLLLQLIRLAPTSRLQNVFWGVFAFTAVLGFGSLLAGIMLCSPPSYLWDRFDFAKPKTGKCGSYLALSYSIPALNVFTDFIVWLAPLMLFRMVQLPFRQKIGLMGVFAIGVLVPISAISRILIVRQTLARDARADPSYTALQMAVWSTVEITVAIICSSIPSLRPLVKRLWPALLGTSYGTAGAALSTGNPGRSTNKGIHLSVMPTHSSSMEQFVGAGGYAADIESGHAQDSGRSEYEGSSGIMVKKEATVSYSNHETP